jgi:hypothetical protein
MVPEAPRLNRCPVAGCIAAVSKRINQPITTKTSNLRVATGTYTSKGLGQGEPTLRIQQPKPRRIRVQMPMAAVTYEEWCSLIDDRLAREARKRLAEKSQRYERHPWTAEDVEGFLKRLFEHDDVIRISVAHHIYRFAKAANAEVGFEIGLKPQQVEIPDSGIVFAFATMKSSAARLLLQLENVRENLDRLTASREWHPDRVVGHPIDECDFIVLVDLLVCSLPKTIEEHPGLDLAALIDRTIDIGLRQYETVNALRISDENPDHSWPIRNDEWVRNPSKTRH